MPASEAQIRANQANATRSTGPRTAEGKAISRANAFKHGLTGEGVALPNEEIEEVERRFASYREQFQPSGEVQENLVRRAAFLSVRLDRCVSHETASLRGRLRQAEADFVAPEGADDATVGQLRAEAKARAMFDPSPEATLARRYEAAAERSYHKALKELHQLQRQARAAQGTVSPEAFRETLASILELKKKAEDFEARYPEPVPMVGFPPARSLESAGFPLGRSLVDVPITIGRRR